MVDKLRQKWNARYREAEEVDAVTEVLSQYQQLLPAQGRALDLACGLGANALFLAKRGLDVCAWDISAVAIDKLNRRAEVSGIYMRAQVRDCIADPPEANDFDVIVVSRFLSRELCPGIEKALKPGGLLFYQTFLQQEGGGDGPSNPDFLLQQGELPQLFAGLHVVFYEEGREAKLVARRGGAGSS